MSEWFGLRPDDGWTIATAVCCNVACGLLGCFLVLRRMSLLGDAISHAVLPGLAGAFILTASRAAVPMLIGAMIVGVLTAFLSSGLSRWGRVPEDAAMGVVFASLFALGVVMITRVASNIDLDPGCVLYGLIEYVPLDRTPVFGVEVPRATLVLGTVLLLDVVLVLLFFKELKIVSFDAYLATTMGINATVVHYGLMAAVAVTVVASFESVGSILVVAMLIVPGATAHLLTDRLDRMLALSAVVATVAAVGGYLLALRWNTSVAGMMAVVAGVEFGLAVLFAPRHGYLSKLLHQAALAVRIAREDMLGMLYRLDEAGRGEPIRRRDLATAGQPGLVAAAALRSLLRHRLAEPAGSEGLRLTPAGRAEAQRLVRAHRLWESYLARHTELPIDHLHAAAERAEHFVTPQMRSELAEGEAAVSDPHGRAIPEEPDRPGT
jgi:manganese/zinc/iron transport system permease protein